MGRSIEQEGLRINILCRWCVEGEQISKVFGEYWFSTESFEESPPGGSVLMLGIRFYGDNFCIDLGGLFRPLGGDISNDTEDIIAIPIIKASYIFSPDPAE